MKRKISLLLIVSFYTLALRARDSAHWLDGVVRHNRGTATIMTDDPRPLWQAVQALSEEYGWTIDYEDPLYSEADVVDRNDAAFAASHPGIKQHVVAGGHFEMSFAEDQNIALSVTEEKDVLQKLVTEYNKSNNPGKFTLIEEGGARFAVVGVNGSPRAVMDTPIRIDSDAANGAFALQDVCDAVTSASGVKVLLMMYPLNLFAHERVDFSHASMPARDLLKQILDATTPRKLEYTVLYDLDDKTDHLSVMIVSKATTDTVTGRRMLEPVGTGQPRQ